MGDGRTKGVPLPSETPPHVPSYQRTVVPLPPIAVSEMVPESSAQKPDLLTEADTGGSAAVSMFTVMLAQADCEHGVSQRAKYVVVAVGDEITSPSPEPMDVPLQESANQTSVVPEPPVAESVMVPASSEQKFVRSLLASVGATGAVPTLTVTEAHADSPQVFVQRAK